MPTSPRVEAIKAQVRLDFQQYLVHAGLDYSRTPHQLRTIFEAYASSVLPDDPAAYIQMFEEDNSLYDPVRVHLDADDDDPGLIANLGTTGVIQHVVRLQIIEALFDLYYNRFKGRRAVMVEIGPDDQIQIVNIVPEAFLPFNHPDLL